MTSNTIFPDNVVPKALADLHYGLRAEFQEDKHPDKINLVIGAYKDEAGQPWVLPVVKKAAQLYHEDPQQNHEYLPLAGDPRFCSAAARVLFGDVTLLDLNQLCSSQTISGTGAVHLGAIFLARFLREFNPTVYLSDPTWDNHAAIFRHAGLSIEWYPYYETTTRSLDIEGMIQKLESATRGSVVVLQACAHNPTGLDPTPEQWKRLASVVQKSGLFPFFDCAYQGFATGGLARDSFPIRYFAEQGIEMFVAQSFSKNLGLYGQRTGCLHFVAVPGPDAGTITARVASQLAALQRVEISTPAAYGAKIASLVLNDKKLFSEWSEDLETMSGRIASMRALLRKGLEDRQIPGDWSHITAQIGMFAYTGLSAEQVDMLRSRWHVYMLPSGRMSVSGLNESNIDYVASAIDAVVRNRTETS
ncbi:pyridoxal phosphate-dependent transferase [Plectosphaerella plurivora]|uniref:aspartate transaminase n=1 Tax=Plectosphaerella plurivora TaxID=936078 RepID=A0A9P8V009_9PEZI|nr:pyridoxal phosphate-dependent transferase [Plectosphaerella plurivora]